MRIVLYCRDYSLTYYEKVPKTIVTKQRMRRKHDVLFPFDRSGRGDAKHWNKLPKAAYEDTRAETKSSEAQTYVFL